MVVSGGSNRRGRMKYSSTAWPLEGYGDCSSNTYTYIVYIYIYIEILYIFFFSFLRVLPLLKFAVAFFVVRSFVRPFGAKPRE